MKVKLVPLWTIKAQLFIGLFMLALLLQGASCNNKPGEGIPPQIPAETEVKIYQTFYQVEAKYNATYDLVVEFSKLVAQTTNLGCSAGVSSICDAGKKYRAFYDEQLRPASQKATVAYMAALSAWEDYRKGTAPEATLTEKIDYLKKVIEDLDALFGQGKAIANVN